MTEKKENPILPTQEEINEQILAACHEFESNYDEADIDRLWKMFQHTLNHEEINEKGELGEMLHLIRYIEAFAKQLRFLSEQKSVSVN